MISEIKKSIKHKVSFFLDLLRSRKKVFIEIGAMEEMESFLKVLLRNGNVYGVKIRQNQKE